MRQPAPYKTDRSPHVMALQGLNDTVYYVVQYAWMLLMYCIFMGIFVGFGSAIGLKIFTKNSYTVQASPAQHAQHASCYNCQALRPRRRRRAT